MMRDIQAGFSGFGQALGFAFRNRMGWMFLVPILLWIAFAAGSIALASWAVDHLTTLAETHLGLDVPDQDRGGWLGFLDDVKAFLNGTRGIITLIAVKVALWYLFGLFGKYVVLILLSPLLAYASERTEELVTGRSFPFSFAQLLKDTLRGVLMALRNAFLETSINLLSWVATFFLPFLAPITLVLMWLVSCWFYGFSMFDYILERQRAGIGASWRAARERQGMVLANGALFWLLMKIPFVGWVFAPLLAAIGAVLAWYGTDGRPAQPASTSFR